MRTVALLASLLLATAAHAQSSNCEIVMPAARISQGGMAIGRAPTGSVVTLDDRILTLASDGHFVFGVARDAKGPLQLTVAPPCGGNQSLRIAVAERAFPVERVNGVPPKTSNPSGDIAKRIEREQALVTAARTRNDDRTDYLQTFIWPVQGRISGRFGSSRSYNGTPGAAHSGMDIAVGTGTPIKAPAAGVISFASPSLYLTGGTVVLDHGQGVSSNFLHMSRIDVRVGDTVRQGQVIGAVGATGRATGPHLHWGMNWLETRIDPLLLLER